MHYDGYLTNGQKFDSSVDRGTPFQFQIGVGQVRSVSSARARASASRCEPFCRRRRSASSRPLTHAPADHTQVILGWDEGVMKMSLGEKAKLTLSPDYGYGARGAGGVIPPNAELVFEVELLKIG